MTTTSDPYAAVLADRTYLDDIDAADLRAVVQQWRVARAEAGDLTVGTHVVEADLDDLAAALLGRVAQHEERAQPRGHVGGGERARPDRRVSRRGVLQAREWRELMAALGQSA